MTTKYRIWLNLFGIWSSIALSLKEGFYKTVLPVQECAVSAFSEAYGFWHLSC